ncbi:MAG: glycosyltransferase family 4 protein [Desulfovibrionaceae bacterium]|nr:glycosyltransferase family 4 protein [Desulfovibrionaceae bacterium]MBF0512478.1 glycosyltransferase family 4 protein [Desulfovibrionaceae bacterium]
MKITIIVGGRWHAFDLARELHKQGCLHRLITNYFTSKTRQFGIPDDKVVSLPSTYFLEKAIDRLARGRLNVPMQYFRHVVFARQAVKFLEGSDLVHAWASFAAPAIGWCGERGVPVVLERGSSHIGYQTEILGEEQRLLGLDCPITHPRIVAMEHDEYRTADRIAVPSGFVRESFLAKGTPREKLAYNPYGVSLDLFRPGARRTGPFRIIFAGSLSYRKGIHYLKEGFLRAGLADAELRLIGGAAKETPLLLKGAGERVITAGHVPQADLVRHYQAGDVFAIASIEEGLAMVQAQALASGLPLICTTNTGGEDLLRLCTDEAPREQQGGIREYPAGYVVPIRDPGAIAWCLRALYEDRRLLEEKREAALQIHEKRLDWTAYATRNVALYETLLH